MKKIVLVMSMLLLFVCGVFAQTEVSNEGTQIILDLSTFTGIVTVISSVVTQIFKLIPAIDGSKIAKIGISVGVGIITFGWLDLVANINLWRGSRIIRMWIL